MKLTLVTGASGFVGRQVLNRLVQAGCPIRVVARAPVSGQSDVVKTNDLFSESPQFWRSAFDGVGRIIHLAWYVEPGQYLTSKLNLDCMVGTLRMASAAADAGVSRFVGIGTCLEQDPTQGAITTRTPLQPNSPYAAAKAGTFLALSQILPRMGVDFAWCRLFYLYGEGEDGRRLVSYLHNRLSCGQIAELTSGLQFRDYMDVSEAGRLIAEVSLSKACGVFNICSGKAVTVEELAGRIAEQYGRPDLLRFGVRQENADDQACVIGEPSIID